MPKEHVVYTGRWFLQAAHGFLQEILRSIAFGLIMFVSFIFLVFIPLLAANTTDGVDGKMPPWATFLGCLCLGLPVTVGCWWAALKVAEDPGWQEPQPTIWDDQPVRWLESTIRFAHYLESQGRPIDMSLVLSKDARAAAHRLIENTDEDMVRAFLAAWLAASSNRDKQAAAQNTNTSHRIDERRLLSQ